MKKNKKSTLTLVVLCCLMILYLINSTFITKHILIYTKLFIEKLFPASFLFFTFSTLLIEYQGIEKISSLLKINSASAFCFLMSLISGFPSGSKYTKELLEKKLITEDKANYLVQFTHFPNPIFILGPVSLLFPNKKYGRIILFSIIISNLIIAVVKRTKENSYLPQSKKEPPTLSKILPKAIFSSIKTLILIYGTSIFFYLIITIINYYIHLPLKEYILLNGLFDLTNGIFLTSLITNPTIRGIFIIFFISFGGISVHMQTKSILTDTPIKYKSFFQGRIIGTILSLTIFLLLNHIFH